MAKTNAAKRAKETSDERKERNAAKSKATAAKKILETEEEARKRKDKEKQQRFTQRSCKIPSSQYEARNAQKVLIGEQIVPELKETKDTILGEWIPLPLPLLPCVLKGFPS